MRKGEKRIKDVSIVCVYVCSSLVSFHFVNQFLFLTPLLLVNYKVKRNFFLFILKVCLNEGMKMCEQERGQRERGV